MIDTEKLHSVLFEVKDYIGTITINRPESRNSLSRGVVTELNYILRELREDNDVRVLILTGAGEKAFSSGGDLSGGMNDKIEVEDDDDPRDGFVKLFDNIRKVGKPIIAMINGYCYAGAFGLALACDLIVAVDYAKFSTPEIKRGLWPMMIMAPIFRNLPRKKAMELILTGDSITAQEAFELNIVNRVASKEDLLNTTMELAKKLANKSPLIMKMGRDAYYEIMDKEYIESIEYLNGELMKVLSTEDAMEGISAFFQKREPVWKGK